MESKIVGHKSAEYWKSLTEFPGLGRKLRILAFYPNHGGCAYYRVINPYNKLLELYPNIIELRTTLNPLGIDENKLKELQAGNPNNHKHPWIEDFDFADMKWADIIVTNNICNYGGWYTTRTCGKAKEFGALFHYDTDDLLTQLYEGHRLKEVYDKTLSENTKFIYNSSDLVTVTQTKFAERIQPFMGQGLLTVVKNAIDYKLPAWSQNKIQIPKDRFVRVGWAGGIHHEEDVKEFTSVPVLVNQKVGKERVRWDFYGKPPLAPGQEPDWQQDVWKNYERIIMAGFRGSKNYTINHAMPSEHYGVMYSNMDIAIAPLQLNDFNDSKSDIKVAEAGRYRVPLIASNVGCYSDTIRNGETGYLLPTGKESKQDWVRILTKVIQDKKLRIEMGENLHKITEQQFDLNKVVHNRLTIYEELLRYRGKLKND